LFEAGHKNKDVKPRLIMIDLMICLISRVDRYRNINIFFFLAFYIVQELRVCFTSLDLERPKQQYSLLKE